MNRTVGNELLQVEILQEGTADAPLFALGAVKVLSGDSWKTLLQGLPGAEFVTSLGAAPATSCQAHQNTDGAWVIDMRGSGAGWQAHERITLAADRPLLRRSQTYRFLRDCTAAVNPGFRLRVTPEMRYTFPLRAHEARFSETPSLRADVAWALPLPCHVWHDGENVVIYGVDRDRGGGTLDFVPPASDGLARLGVFVPDTAQQIDDIDQQWYTPPRSPGHAAFAAGDQATIAEIVAVSRVRDGDEPLLEGERMAAEHLLGPTRAPADLAAVAEGIARFYRDCQLWEPDAFGKGLGWFLNMWVHTQAGTPQRRGPGGGFFDLGWGEGIAAETIVGLTRYWQRTNQVDVLTYVDAMTRSMERFKRSPAAGEPYFDRSDGQHFFDFRGGARIWLHSLGHTASQLLQAYVEAPDYPDPTIRDEWLRVARESAAFCARVQLPDGNLPNVVDDEDCELLPPTKHSIPARAVVCGLWALLASVSGEKEWIDRALQLAAAVAPEIERYEFDNQMIDALTAPMDIPDGECAYYVLEGLVPLYEATGDLLVLSLCKKAAAFGLAWTYFYDLPHAYRGIARGGQVCRMPDFPLLYPIGPAKGVAPLEHLSRLTGDPFLHQMAAEMVAFMSRYQIDAPGLPWHGGMIHAIEQYDGKHWGPGKAGQVDTGMATGNSLSALEFWLAACSRPAHDTSRERTPDHDQGDEL